MSISSIHHKNASAQAAALPQLCSQLRLAKGLRQLVLDMHGRAARAVPASLPRMRCLTQLDSLQLGGIGSNTEGDHISVALRPLTRLTRLSLHFIYDDTSDDPEEEEDDEDGRTVFPWAAVCKLTSLQQLCITAAIDPDLDCGGILRGALPPAVSKLTALRSCIVLGMDTCEVHNGREEPVLPALPALENLALQLHTWSYVFPGLGRQQQAVLSRIVSLRLELRFNAESGGLYDSTVLPVIVAPALTELTLAGMWLALDSGELSWLANLPKLRRLALTDVETPSSELSKGVTACNGLTELVLEGVRVLRPRDDSDSDDEAWPCLLRHLLASGPYLSKLVRLGLPRNIFSSVPPSLAAATSLELLDMANQRIEAVDEGQHGAPLFALHVPDKLPRLRGVNLRGFEASEQAVRSFQAAHPGVSVMMQQPSSFPCHATLVPKPIT